MKTETQQADYNKLIEQTLADSHHASEQTTSGSEQTRPRRIDWTEIAIICGGLYFLIRFILS